MAKEMSFYYQNTTNNQEIKKSFWLQNIHSTEHVRLKGALWLIFKLNKRLFSKVKQTINRQTV